MKAIVALLLLLPPFLSGAAFAQPEPMRPGCPIPLKSFKHNVGTTVVEILTPTHDPRMILPIPRSKFGYSLLVCIKALNNQPNYSVLLKGQGDQTVPNGECRLIITDKLSVHGPTVQAVPVQFDICVTGLVHLPPAQN